MLWSCGMLPSSVECWLEGGGGEREREGKEGMRAIHGRHSHVPVYQLRWEKDTEEGAKLVAIGVFLWGWDGAHVPKYEKNATRAKWTKTTTSSANSVQTNNERRTKPNKQWSNWQSNGGFKMRNEGAARTTMRPGKRGTPEHDAGGSRDEGAAEGQRRRGEGDNERRDNDDGVISEASGRREARKGERQEET